MKRKLLPLVLLLGITANASSWFGASKTDELQQHRGLNALYAQIDQSISNFQAGLELKRSGNPKSGQRQIDQALQAMHAASGACARVQQCETERFYDGLQTMLKLQSIMMDEPAGLAGNIDQVELDEARIKLIGAKLPEMGRSISMLKGRQLRQLIELNETTKASIDEWLTWMRPQLIETYKNYAYMRPLMLPEYEKAGLPEALLFGILARESVGRVHSFSKSGAAGPLQFMPVTGQRFGLRNANGFDERLDPSLAARANVQYINEQLARLNNDLELVLAAYNGGEGRVQRLHQQTRKGFWNDQVYFSLPQETRDYVPKVLAAAYLFLHPEEFNLQFPAVSGATAEVKIQNALSLSELTVCLGQAGREDGWFRTLRNLNPRAKPDERMPSGSIVKIPEAAMGAYQSHCRDSRFMARIADLHEARNLSGPGFVAYTVRKGDTLAAIARRTQCMPAGTIAELNDIVGPKFAITPGQRIKLPACG
jgi:membrane-bound lytic murein transglycosylase D